MANFNELAIWQKARLLVTQIYDLTSMLPETEKFGLQAQMRRAAVSVPSNIAEGSKRGSKDFARFIDIAYGSLAELETQFLIVRDVHREVHNNFGEVQYNKILDEIDQLGKMMFSFKRYLK